MLKSFTLKNFKSFKEATLQLTPTVTFLIGANGSGKSNALEALRLLNCLGKGESLRDFETKVNSQSPIIRGPSSELIRRGEMSFCLEVKIENSPNELFFSLDIGRDKQTEEQGKVRNLVFNSEELKDSSGKVIYSTFENSNPLPKVVKAFSATQGQALFIGLQALSLLVASTQPSIPQKQIKELNFGTMILKNHFSNIHFWNFNPEKMRGYCRQMETVNLAESGENLSAILEKLCQNSQLKREILDFIRSLPEQDIEDITFSITDTGYVMVRLEEEFSSSLNSMTSYALSDGTLRALAIAAALYGAPEGSLIVIEEVDNGIHPSRIKHLVDKMYEIAAERKIQILVTTHDPAMMDAIPQQEKANVLCCYRNKEDGCSRILRFQDSPQYMDFLTNGRLGSFVATDQFDKLVRQTEEERAKEHKAWFEQYQKEQDEYYEKLRQALKED